MNIIIKLFILFFCLSAFAEEFSGNRCAHQDWYQLGLSDGINGYPAANIKIAQKECAAYAIIVDTSAYMAGWQRGIQTYYDYYNNVPIVVNPPVYLGPSPQYYTPYYYPYPNRGSRRTYPEDQHH